MEGRRTKKGRFLPTDCINLAMKIDIFNHRANIDYTKAERFEGNYLKRGRREVEILLLKRIVKDFGSLELKWKQIVCCFYLY